MMTDFTLTGHPPAEPFIPWVGGKRRFIHDISYLLPVTIRSYFEPFLGGGAMFFAVEPTLNFDTQHAILTDINGDLIDTYTVVRDHVEDLIAALKEHAKGHELDRKGYYASVKRTEETELVARAARFIYLIQTSYKNMWATNKSGKFSNTIGDKTGNNICDADGLRNASRALHCAHLKQGSYEKMASIALEGDFIFCDPPYDGTYDRYAGHRFTRDDQTALRDHAITWSNEYGANVMIWNSDTTFIRDLYGDPDTFTIWNVGSRHRIININAGAPGDVEQVIITTY